MISIIIPTHNESETIASLITYLLSQSQNVPIEIIVADGGSKDDTLALATKAGATAVLSPKKGRATQMNFGASFARFNILYFIHADTLPPENFITDIITATQQGYGLGRYTTRFCSKSPLLKVNAFFTRFDWTICSGGDQTLFITRTLFNSLKGFNENMQIMEDYEMVARARKQAKYKIIKKPCLVSARKYDTNSWLTVQRANHTIVQMYRKGATQQQMTERYKQMLAYR